MLCCDNPSYQCNVDQWLLVDFVMDVRMCDQLDVVVLSIHTWLVLHMCSLWFLLWPLWECILWKTLDLFSLLAVLLMLWWKFLQCYFLFSPVVWHLWVEWYHIFVKYFCQIFGHCPSAYNIEYFAHIYEQYTCVNMGMKCQQSWKESNNLWRKISYLYYFLPDFNHKPI